MPNPSRPGDFLRLLRPGRVLRAPLQLPSSRWIGSRGQPLTSAARFASLPGLMSDSQRLLAELSEGFRHRYLDYATLTRQLERWASRFPNLLRLESLGLTPEGRCLWLASVGPEPERARPAYWVNANVHAREICGSNVALALIEDLLLLHLDSENSGLELPRPVAEVAREVMFYVMPRVSPDGVEAALQTGRALRSVPRDARPKTGAPVWRALDLDGDGRALALRYQSDAGEFVESKTEPGLMLRRRIEDEGPFYHMAIEGVIDDFDGVNVPSVGAFNGHFPDLNRNFPYSWVPEPEQVGAGPFPASEPESRAVVEFASSHPNIFAWADLHSFGGVFIRPLGHGPDSDMHQQDLAIYHQLAQWAGEHTGYPTVSGFTEFTYSPKQPLHGDLVDFAYHQRGAFAYTVELWDLFKRLGLAKPERFAAYYVKLTEADYKALWHWDRESNLGRIFCGWRSVEHPQLGAVEVGGLDPLIGIWNPPEQFLEELCRAHVNVMLRVAALSPRIRLTAIEVQSLGAETWRVALRIENLGYLPSFVLDSANQGPLGAPLRLEFTTDGCEVMGPRQLELNHLGGWGRGLFGLTSSMLSATSPGSAHRAQVEVTLRGRGSLNVKASGLRLGAVELQVASPV